MRIRNPLSITLAGLIDQACQLYPRKTWYVLHERREGARRRSGYRPWVRRMRPENARSEEHVGWDRRRPGDTHRWANTRPPAALASHRLDAWGFERWPF